MNEAQRWLNRVWKLDVPPALHPVLIERMRGTPVRLEESLRAVPHSVLVQRLDDTWSILENAGHLFDLEELWMGRLADYAAGLPRLRAWDVSNRKTHEALHNERPAAATLAKFRAARTALCARLDELTETDFARSARHPRLDQDLRLIDHCVFVAEHDDHHLARITELKRRLDVKVMGR